MTPPKQKSPREMRDDILKLVYAKAKSGEMNPAQLNSALKSLADIAKNDPTPEEQPIRWVGDEIGNINNLPPVRRKQVMEEWRRHLVREIEVIDKWLGRLDQEAA